MINAEQPWRPSRRMLLRLFGVGSVASATIAMTACATKASASTGATIMIIRHAEKPPDSGTPQGVDPDGSTDKHALTVTGWTRAGALVELFAPARGTPVQGLHTPDALYASLGGDSNSVRTGQTITPLAARISQTINTTYSKGQEAALAAELITKTGMTLVSWQHEAIPDIVRNLGSITPTAPTTWPDERFDMVWVFTAKGNNTWQFTQVPQLLLAGDSATPI